MTYTDNTDNPTVQPSTHPPTIYTVSALAEELGTTPAALAMMRSRGTGPRYSKLTARLVVYRRHDVLTWLAANMRTSTRAVSE